LHGRKHDPANICTAIKSKCSSYLIEWQKFREFPDVVQEVSAHVVQIAVYERLLHVEAAGDDVFCILQPELVCILERESVLEKCLLVIRQHDYYPNHQLSFQKLLVEKNTQRHIKHILQPLRKCKWNRVSQMQRIARWPSPRIQEEWLACLVPIEDLVEIPV